MPGTRRYFNTCAICGSRFHPNRRQQLTCSRKCGVVHRTGPTARGSKLNHNAQCKTCGAPLYRKPYLVTKSRNHFCSSACANHYKRVLYRGASNPNYSAAGRRSCECCGEEFVTYARARRFCSVACAGRGARISSGINAAVGLEYEKKCAAKLRQMGYSVTLSAASRGAYDVIAFSRAELRLVQVKFARRNTNQKRNIDALRAAVAPPGAKKELWVFVLNSGWNILEVSE